MGPALAGRAGPVAVSVVEPAAGLASLVPVVLLVHGAVVVMVMVVVVGSPLLGAAAFPLPFPLPLLGWQVP